MNARYATCYANEASWSDKGQHKFCAYRVWSPATAGFSSTVIKSKLDEAALAERLPDFEQALAAQSNLAIVQAVSGPIVRLENAIKARVKPRPEIKYLTTIAGVGDILGWTILLESADIRRFPKTGKYTPYCRCVDSKRTSNEKKK